MNTNAQMIEILLVEDNPGDAKLAQKGLEKSKLYNNLTIVEDGEQALDFVFKRNEFINVKTPDLILLDLNLPKISGQEVLAKIKNNPNLRKIPVVILTTSDSDEDIMKSYDLHANCYITKPIDLQQFIKVVNNIEDFWLSIVKLPKIQ